LVLGAENSGLHVFDFLANSILREVLFAIQKGKPGAFSVGRPTEFLKNYKSSLEFLAYLEGIRHISFPLILLFTLRNKKNES
jgi:conserved oligomeric Golgi complex subunit 2